MENTKYELVEIMNQITSSGMVFSKFDHTVDGELMLRAERRNLCITFFGDLIDGYVYIYRISIAVKDVCVKLLHSVEDISDYMKFTYGILVSSDM